MQSHNSFRDVCAGLSLTQIGGYNYSYAASDTVIFYAYDPTDASARLYVELEQFLFRVRPLIILLAGSLSVHLLVTSLTCTQVRRGGTTRG